MTWERDPLWTKAKLYMGRAFASRDDVDAFGIWCSLGLELLARAAVATVSPALLAEPDREHINLLHALGYGSDKAARRSIGTIHVLGLCRKLFESFKDQHFKDASAIIGRRNDELHTGTAAFQEYPPRHWESNFYRICKVLTEAMGETLESFLGDDEASSAQEMLEEVDNGLMSQVQSKIAAYAKVFKEKTDTERADAAKAAAKEAEKLAYRRHHKVECPACGCSATIKGETVGKSRTDISDDEIFVRESVSPKTLQCNACGLRLESYRELEAARLGGLYTRKSSYSPEEYYNLVNPETYDWSEEFDAYISSNPDMFLREYREEREYDNE